MCQQSVNSDGASERLPVPDEAIVEETDGGKLIFMEIQPDVKELLGFAEISNIDILSDELRMRGIDTRAVFDKARFPTFTERPDDCDCTPTFEDLPCWPCYRDGFEAPNPEVSDE